MLDDKSHASDRVGPASGNGQAASPGSRLDSGLEPTHTVFAEEIEQSVPDRFEKIVRTYPDRLAVKMGDRALTYDELNRTANRIARAILEKRGPGSEPIALLFEHGIDVIAAIFGALKAGKFYVALDPSFPQERIAYILEDSQAGLILTNNRNLDLAQKLTKDARALINIDEFDGSDACDNLGLALSPEALVDICYTSGSTGKPKGVVRKHRQVLNFAVLAETGICTDDRLTLVHFVGFGSASDHLISSLLNGASLFPFDIKSEGVCRLASWLREEQITICHLPPAAFRQLAEVLSDQEKLPRLRMIRLSGAPITRLDFDLYKKNFSATTLLKIGMGSTEAGWICSAVLNRSFSFPKEGSPVGYPHWDKKILLLDENGHEVGSNQVGEIAVLGGLAAGYWKKPDLTGAKFVPDPSAGDETTYLTGDLGRMLPDGFLIHLGRKDFQVKIRGYRVEIAEIERALLAHPQLKEAGIVAWDREPGEKYLVAYVVSRTEPAPTIEALHDILKQTLPDYMMPSAFMFLESLPLTNGKLDRTALPLPDSKRPDMRRPYVPPQRALERKLVRIWEEVLDIRPIGIHDDFFDLGGHSLMGASLMAQVQRDFQVDLPLKLLFESPTIAKLATCVAEFQEKSPDRRQAKQTHSYLVGLQSGDKGRTPVFFFPGGGGTEPEFFIYAKLARHVGTSYSFYGLRARGADGVSQPHRRVEEMATDYLQEMRTVQPHGPYFLVGECYGGAVTHEVARQLQAKGEKIALLALMDSQRPTKGIYLHYRTSQWVEPVLGSYFVQRIPFHWKTLCKLDHRERIPYLFDKVAKALPSSSHPVRHEESTRSRAQAVVEVNTDTRVIQHIEWIRDRYRRALRWHKPKPYGGRIQILVNEEFYSRDPTLGWSRLALGGLDIHKLPGDHDSYIREHVQAAAKKLRECLEKAAMEAPP